MQGEHIFVLKKRLAFLVHAVFFLMLVAGYCGICICAAQRGPVLPFIRSEYTESAEFLEKFSQDLERVIEYLPCRDAFETDGELDLTKEMFSIARDDGSQVSYTLDEIVRYARGQGLYLDENFEVESEIYLYGDVMTGSDVRILWRAYPEKTTVTGPGDDRTSLLELSREVLECLGEYYYVRENLIDADSNFSFRVECETGSSNEVYTNRPGMSAEDMKQLGAYLDAGSDTSVIDTALPGMPAQVSALLRDSSLYDSDSYRVVFAVDKSFAAADGYGALKAAFDTEKRRCTESAILFAAGLLGLFFSFVYIAGICGYEDAEKKHVRSSWTDLFCAEDFLLFEAFLLAVAMLALRQTYRYFLALFVPQEYLRFGGQVIAAAFIYWAGVWAGSELLRRKRAGTLLKNSRLKKTYENLTEYMAQTTFARRLLAELLSFGGAMVLLSAGAALSFGSGQSLYRMAVGLLCIFFIICCFKWAYRRMFFQSRQEDEIARIIDHMADGDVAFKVDTDNFYGKEKRIAESLFEIGRGLEKAIDEQVKSERLKADLITNVSHDIKTPLTSIINYVDLIKREKIQNERLSGYIEVLEQKSQRLKTLTEDLVEASKASSGNLRMDMEVIDLVEMVCQAEGEYAERFEARRLQLVPKALARHIMIMADGRYLWRILENLYGNAIKYSMTGSRVYTQVSEEDGFGVFSIKNMSELQLGISPEELTERFVRADASRTTEGSGLGLFIARNLTELQAGSLKIDVNGDLFTVTIRLGLADLHIDS